MVNLAFSEIDVTQAVLRLASQQDRIPEDLVEDIQLLIFAIDERIAKLLRIEEISKDKYLRDDIYGNFTNSNAIVVALEREELIG